MIIFDSAPQFNWTHVGSPEEVPLLIASRVILAAEGWLWSLGELGESIPEAEVRYSTDPVTQQYVRCFKLKHLVMIGDEGGSMRVEALRQGRWHSIDSEEAPEPPIPLTDVLFERWGSGKSYLCEAAPRRQLRPHRVEMNWRIANVVDLAMKGLKKRVTTGTWPLSGSGFAA